MGDWSDHHWWVDGIFPDGSYPLVFGEGNPSGYFPTKDMAQRVADLLNADDEANRRAQLLTGGDPA